MTSYFIYYRVSPQRINDLTKAVSEIRASVLEATGVAGRLMRRDDTTETWMEVYEKVGETRAFETALKQAVADAGFDALLADDSTRHIERFVDA